MKFDHQQNNGKVGWRSPSNIALVKYWGKYGDQHPSNPSLSLTLEKSYTETTITYSKKQTNGKAVSVDFRFEGERNQSFSNRVTRYFEKIRSEFDWIARYHFEICSSNSFPHSAGIASSASAYSALALCLCSIHEKLCDQPIPKFWRKASQLARLGSGSACRSVYRAGALWGHLAARPESSEDFAVEISDLLHEDVATLQDSILIISEEEKGVSSSAGHSLMHDHPYAKTRFDEARKNVEALLPALKQGDLHEIGILVEMEAMQLHALMMCSNPNYILMQPNTIRAIQKIKAYRKQSGHPVYFTLDAGPNLHVLYPKKLSQELVGFIQQELAPLCSDGKWIDDKVGSGPQKI